MNIEYKKYQESLGKIIGSSSGDYHDHFPSRLFEIPISLFFLFNILIIL